ncbi:hypothetical protein BKA82DRAFT_4331458 [Pisolithus tinctorius]|nr:hypothetical protein BKA82DRAFT_4331458 [Pisolithus tinctorius]
MLPLRICQISVTGLIYENHYLVIDLLKHTGEVFDAFLHHAAGQDQFALHSFHMELHSLASEDNGWHFGASSAPKWWGLLGTLLDDKGSGEPGGQNEHREFGNYWDEVDEIDLEGMINELTGEYPSVKERRANHHSAIKLMKKTIVSSVLMHGTNQKSNTLQSLLGLFLQSAHTPYKVIDTLAHLGISESQNSLQQLGRSLLASYAYDNFDIDLKHYIPTAETSSDSLKHLTSGLLFPLVHGVMLDDLKFQPGSNANLSYCNQFNLWLFLHDLCTHGPEYFHQFKSMIQTPESMEQIPTLKTPIFVAQAMDVNNSTVSGNIQAIMDLLKQGGVEDPAVLSPDISEYVVLVHGDLGTGERLQMAQLCRSIESTSWNRLQHVIFIPGLFHLKMACADALWRCFIYPSAAHDDEMSLMRDVAQLCPKETGIYTTKPGFHCIHQLVSHASICWCLDCWRVLASQKNGFDNLKDFARSKPTLEDLEALAKEIIRTYVATGQFCCMRRKQDMEHDSQFENALLLNKYFLLYEELSYAMNSGDIGRVEASIVSWIPILKAVKNGGKGSNCSVERIILESPLVQVVGRDELEENDIAVSWNWGNGEVVEVGTPVVVPCLSGVETKMEGHGAE